MTTKKPKSVKIKQEEYSQLLIAFADTRQFKSNNSILRSLVKDTLEYFIFAKHFLSDDKKFEIVKLYLEEINERLNGEELKKMEERAFK